MNNSLRWTLLFPNFFATGLLPHPDGGIPSGYEEDASSTRDAYAAWVEGGSRLYLETPPGQRER